MAEARENPGRPLPAGRQAPDFTLPVSPDKTLSLHNYRGQPVILVFYPADWSPVCGGQVQLYNELLPEFQKYNAAILGLSVDSVWSHAAFRKELNLNFPLLADFHPHGAVARKYGAFRDEDGYADRALFVIDAGGVIAWSFLSPGGIEAVNPGADGILKALANLKEKQKER